MPPINATIINIKLPKYTYNWKPGLSILDISDNLQSVMVDCSGGIINGSRIGNTTGIYVNTTNVDVTIKNCIIQNYDTNVYLENFDGDFFINNTLRYAVSKNIKVKSAKVATFDGLNIFK